MLTYSAIVAIDPHDHLGISWPAQRAPINGNQRFSYPAIARSGRYDSVVLGTSTTRSLVPAELDAQLHARFANFSMNSATAYEQNRLFQVFVRASQARGVPIQWVLIGLDAVWCDPQEAVPRYTFREFPEWLYDSNPLNDYLHVFNARTLEQAARQVQYWRGKLAPYYGFDGYKSFLPAAKAYDLNRAREHLYGSTEPRQRVRPLAPLVFDDMTRAGWHYAALTLLGQMLDALPPTTSVAFVFVPYHLYHQPIEGTASHWRWQECKQRVARLGSSRRNTFVLDFMIDSGLTRADKNYWDPLHFTTGVASEMVSLIAQAIERGSDIEDRVLVLAAPKR